MSVYKGAYSSNDRECNTGVNLDDNAYNPGPEPNVYVSNAKGLNKINLASKIDANFYESIGTEGDGLKGGFSGRVSRNRK